MGNDPTQQLLGVTQSSDRPGTTDYQSDPVSFPAGIACRLGTDGLLTTRKAGVFDLNMWNGISLGKSLLDPKQTSVLRAGSRVPILLSGVDFVVPGENVYIDDYTGLATENSILSTVSNAVYVSGVLDGIDLDGNILPIALVDMIGGL